MFILMFHHLPRFVRNGFSTKKTSGPNYFIITNDSNRVIFNGLFDDKTNRLSLM